MIIKIHSLRWKILGSLALASILSILFSSAIVHYVLTKQQRANMETRLSVVGMMAHASIRNLMVQQHSEDLGKFILDFARQSPLAGVRIFQSDGRITFSNDSTELGTTVQKSNFPDGADDLRHFMRVKNGLPVLTSISPIIRSADCASCHPGPGRTIGYLGVDVKAEQTDREVATAQRWMIASSVFIVAIFIGTAFGVHFRFVKKRTKKLAIGISQLAEGNFGYRIETRQLDELDYLASQINRLGDRLDTMREELAKSHLAELERAERMASVGELAASIAHEIRNPVAGISSAMQVLTSELEEGDERAQIFQEIVRQTQRVNRAVNDLLSYARPSTPEPGVCSLNDPIHRVLVLMEAQKNENKVVLSTDFEPNLPPSLIDVEQMQQVFLNLVMNALQAMPSGGSLLIRTYATSTEVVAEVTDTGPGIPKEIIQDVFKPFFTTKHQGTGLGLSISRSIVESHFGKMEVDSIRGEGSTFRIKLPIHRIEEVNETI